MIRYEGFCFACPPRTGTGWLVKAAQLAGLGPGFRKHAHAVFNGTEDGVLRVSLVRDPRDWLQSCYTSIVKKEPDSKLLGRFNSLPRDSFDEWIEAYLDDPELSVTGMFDSYQADTVMRIEDQPWAFLELLESVGVDEEYRKIAKQCPPQNVSVELPPWNLRLRDEVGEKESSIMEKYEYA